jgi:hypothetical protein
MNKTGNEVLDALGSLLELIDHEASPEFGNNGVVSEDGHDEGVFRTGQLIADAKDIYNKYAGIVPKDLTKIGQMGLNPPLYPAQRNYVKGCLIEFAVLLTDSFDAVCGSVSPPPEVKNYSEEIPDDNRSFMCDKCDLQANCETVFGHGGKNCRIIALGMVYKKREEYTEPIEKESNVEADPDLDQ